jgi:hypothetical protein
VLGELKSRYKQNTKASSRTKNIAIHEVNQGKNKSHAKTGLVARNKTTAKTRKTAAERGTAEASRTAQHHKPK